MVKTYNKKDNKQLTQNFKLSEIHCHGKGCCDKTKLDIAIVKYAQQMRDILGVPITIESGYRCEKHNKLVGGALGSGHTLGTALDLVTTNISKERLSVLAELIGVPRIGIYDSKKNMIHIGLGNKLHWINTGNYLNASHSFLNGAWKKPTLKVNPTSKKEYIRWVQGWLFVRGFYDGKIDGNWGKNTQNAIDKFRISNKWKKATYLRTKGINTLCK